MPGAAPVAGRPDDALDQALRDGARRLTAAGIDSARTDVEILAAHLLGLPRGQVAIAAVLGRPAPPGLAELVERRARRVPIQHLTGTAGFRGLDLAVGQGVFVPRPETEQVAEVAIKAAQKRLEDRGAVTVVDLCTGSGAIALAVAHEVPGAAVHAVELDATAYAWACRNVERLAGALPPVDLRRGDARTAFGDLDGTVDVVVSNPPYIPPDAVPLDPEVRDHDPAVALYGLGTDGLTVPRGVVHAAARLLRPGGVLVMEHAEVQAATLRSFAEATGLFRTVRTRQDLAGRDRMLVAERMGGRRGPDVKDSRP